MRLGSQYHSWAWPVGCSGVASSARPSRPCHTGWLPTRGISPPLCSPPHESLKHTTWHRHRCTFACHHGVHSEPAGSAVRVPNTEVLAILTTPQAGKGGRQAPSHPVKFASHTAAWPCCSVHGLVDCAGMPVRLTAIKLNWSWRQGVTFGHHLGFLRFPWGGGGLRVCALPDEAGGRTAKSMGTNREKN
jgi:hypothetical protein